MQVIASSIPRVPAILIALVSICLSAKLDADDWSMWMGPNRDNTWNESGLIDSFPDGGPKEVWSTEIGLGYSGPSVAEGKIVVTDFFSDSNVKIANFERREFKGVERVLCLDEKTGKILWKHETPLTYTISYPSGPRCTPIIENNRVYTLGAEGNFYCFDLSTGDIVWSKSLKKEYSTKSALWGYAAHPLIDGDKIITLAGGKGSHIVALDKNSGSEIWRSLTAPEQGYAPPTIIESGEKRQLITLRPDAVTSINPETGKEFWSVPYEANSGSIIMSPLAIGNYLYAGGYSKKSLMVKLNWAEMTAEVMWRNKGNSAISPVNVQPYLDKENSIAYGMDQTGDMRAMRFPEGDLAWATSKPVSKRRVGNGTAFIVRIGKTDRYWLFNDSGELIIAEITPKGYSEIDRAKVIEPSNNAFNRAVVWSMPAFANRRVYIRNDNKIICLDVSK